MEESFTVKEVVMEIKEDLHEFREKYDRDIAHREVEFSKRPTRSELYALVAGAGTLVGIAVTLLGA